MLERRARLFRNGRNQAVRIPRELELPGTQALIRKENGNLVIEPLPKPSLVELLRSWEPIEGEIGPVDDPPPEPVEI
jgi:antitoxin VapB